MRPGPQLAGVGAQHLLLDRQYLRRVHREAAQSQPEQEPGETDIACHLATNAHALGLPVAFGNGVGDQTQHGRVQRVVQMRYRLVGTIDCQRVLDQVVSADRQEVKILQEQLERQRGSRNLDHGTEPHRPVGRSPAVELHPGLLEQAQGLADLARMGQHRNQQIDLPESGSAKYRAQLGQKHIRVR